MSTKNRTMKREIFVVDDGPLFLPDQPEVEPTPFTSNTGQDHGTDRVTEIS